MLRLRAGTDLLWLMERTAHWSHSRECSWRAAWYGLLPMRDATPGVPVDQQMAAHLPSGGEHEDFRSVLEKDMNSVTGRLARQLLSGSPKTKVKRGDGPARRVMGPGPCSRRLWRMQGGWRCHARAVAAGRRAGCHWRRVLAMA